jgi:hypothetical protein
MNKTEARFAVMLNQLKHSGEIVEWKYADVQFQLGEFRCWYRPDFRVIEIDGTITFIETKGGYIWDDSKVKFKAAARQYPEFNWAMYQEKKGKWSTLYSTKGERYGHDEDGKHNQERGGD